MSRKRIVGAIICLVLMAYILPMVGSAIAVADSSASGKLFCSECGKQIPIESKFCMYCGHEVISVSNPAGGSFAWGNWSSWSTSRVYASDTCQVERRTVITGYNMVHYGTQMADPPYYRMFRNYSIQAHLGDYNARASYGEKHFTRYITPGMLSYAVQYEPGEYIKGEYAGYQCGSDTAYSFGDDKYVWFIESAEERTEYRYRELKG